MAPAMASLHVTGHGRARRTPQKVAAAFSTGEVEIGRVARPGMMAATCRRPGRCENRCQTDSDRLLSISCTAGHG